MPRKGGSGGGDDGPSKAWLDSYADAMTLLLAFFILLYASSLIDEDKFIDFKVGVAQALGQPSPAIEGGVGVLDSGNGITSLIAAASAIEDDGAEGNEEDAIDLDEVQEVTRDNAEDIVEELERRIEEVGAAPYVDVVDDPRGVILRFDSQVLFRSGEAKVLPDGVVVLTTVAEVLSAVDNLLVIEGHTDDLPTSGTEWPTNWELSTNRATNVLRFLTEVAGVAPVRLSAAGYADTRPRVSNATAEGRAENRRVEVVLIVDPFQEQTVALESTASEVPEAADFGAGITDPAAPEIVPDNLLDVDPAPVAEEPES